MAREPKVVNGEVVPTVPADQNALDLEDVRVRLDRLATALRDEESARQQCRELKSQLKRAEVGYRGAKERVAYLAALEWRRVREDA